MDYFATKLANSIIDKRRPNSNSSVRVMLYTYSRYAGRVTFIFKMLKNNFQVKGKPLQFLGKSVYFMRRFDI